jgi:hypothetical protein
VWVIIQTLQNIKFLPYSNSTGTKVQK